MTSAGASSPRDSLSPVSHRREDLHCPRCRYDLRGQVETWDEACPLHGKCSECGLDFDWEQVFREQLHPWLFEHQWRTDPVRSWLKTLWMAAMPWEFWKRVGMVHRIHLRVGLTCLVIFLSFVLVADFVRLMVVVERIFPFLTGPPAAPSPGTAPPELSTKVLRSLVSLEVFDLGARQYFCLALWLFIMPMTFLFLPVSLSRARVDHRHIMRIAVYAAVPVLVLLGIQFVAAPQYETLSDAVTDTYNQRLGSTIRRACDLILGWPSSWYLQELMLPLVVWGLIIVPGWGWACGRYVKLPRPWLVAILLGAMTMTLGISVIVIFEIDLG